MYIFFRQNESICVIWCNTFISIFARFFRKFILELFEHCLTYFFFLFHLGSSPDQNQQKVYALPGSANINKSDNEHRTFVKCKIINSKILSNTPGYTPPLTPEQHLKVTTPITTMTPTRFTTPSPPPINQVCIYIFLQTVLARAYESTSSFF